MPTAHRAGGGIGGWLINRSGLIEQLEYEGYTKQQGVSFPRQHLRELTPNS